MFVGTGISFIQEGIKKKQNISYPYTYSEDILDTTITNRNVITQYVVTIPTT